MLVYRLQRTVCTAGRPRRHQPGTVHHSPVQLYTYSTPRGAQSCNLKALVLLYHGSKSLGASRSPPHMPHQKSIFWPFWFMLFVSRHAETLWGLRLGLGLGRVRASEVYRLRLRTQDSGDRTPKPRSASHSRSRPATGARRACAVMLLSK